MLPSFPEAECLGRGLFQQGRSIDQTFWIYGSSKHYVVRIHLCKILCVQHDMCCEGETLQNKDSHFFILSSVFLLRIKVIDAF